jgi:hypothetical protein
LRRDPGRCLTRSNLNLGSWREEQNTAYIAAGSTDPNHNGAFWHYICSIYLCAVSEKHTCQAFGHLPSPGVSSNAESRRDKQKKQERLKSPRTKLFSKIRKRVEIVSIFRVLNCSRKVLFLKEIQFKEGKKPSRNQDI